MAVSENSSETLLKKLRGLQRQREASPNNKGIRTAIRTAKAAITDALEKEETAVRAPKPVPKAEEAPRRSRRVPYEACGARGVIISFLRGKTGDTIIFPVDPTKAPDMHRTEIEAIFRENGIEADIQSGTVDSIQDPDAKYTMSLWPQHREWFMVTLIKRPPREYPRPA